MLHIFLSMYKVQTLVLVFVLAFVVELSVGTFWHNTVFKLLLFFLHFLSILFHCVKLAVVSCFYIYLE